MRFQERVVMVTGGARGIGLAIAQRFAREGAAVAVCDKDGEGARRAAEELAGVQSASRAYALDVRSTDGVQAAVDAITRDYGRIDVLVNNAGITIPGPVVDFAEVDWDLMVDVNLKGVFRCAQRVARVMVAQGSGRIINISSESGKTGKPLFALYAATKFGVIGFTQGLAMELAPHGITVNAVCPGIVRTEMWTQLDKDLARLQGSREGEALELRRKSIPLGRLQEPADVAGVVAFLASEDAGYMTGQSVNVTGGREVH
ncbi:MAG: SDR family oxidoreductase [Spirochaetaceae bacterium]|nr:MAG: SDR family oxidoreductase [Spirochaetaceae bacterium]